MRGYKWRNLQLNSVIAQKICTIEHVLIILERNFDVHLKLLHQVNIHHLIKNLYLLQGIIWKKYNTIQLVTTIQTSWSETCYQNCVRNFFEQREYTTNFIITKRYTFWVSLGSAAKDYVDDLRIILHLIYGSWQSVSFSFILKSNQNHYMPSKRLLYIHISEVFKFCAPLSR